MGGVGGRQGGREREGERKGGRERKHVLYMDVGMYAWCLSSMHVWRVLRWWHQTLHLEPSIAIASQYSNQRNMHAVLAHVARWCGLDIPGDFSPGPSGFWPRSSHSPPGSAFSVFALVSLFPLSSFLFPLSSFLFPLSSFPLRTHAVHKNARVHKHVDAHVFHVYTRTRA